MDETSKNGKFNMEKRNSRMKETSVARAHTHTHTDTRIDIFGNESLSYISNVDATMFVCLCCRLDGMNAMSERFSNDQKIGKLSFPFAASIQRPRRSHIATHFPSLNGLLCLFLITADCRRNRSASERPKHECTRALAFYVMEKFSLVSLSLYLFTEWLCS